MLGPIVICLSTHKLPPRVEFTSVVKDVPVPANSAISVLDGKIIAETTDTVKVTSNTASSADVIVSALEQT